MMKTCAKRNLLATAMAGCLMGAAGTAQGANWLLLQGTEPADAAARARIWGFIQPEYQYTNGSDIAAGPWAGQDAAFNQIGPDLDTDNQFNIRRARLGVRGTGFPLDSKVNYFLLLEAGNNGITNNGGGSVKVTDASVTLNHFKGARIRLGQFKYPGSEEGLKAIHVFDYINFTNATRFLTLERFMDYDGSGTFVRPNPAAPPPALASDSGRSNEFNGPVGAFRDIGVQVFDAFRKNDWEHSYAVMVGNGNGITRADNDDNKDVYLYWSSEKIFGGKGPRRDGWKLYGWYQDGRRTLTLEQGTATPTDDVEDEFDRTRWGLGTTFRRGKWRAEAEYIKADGMIFNGTDGGAVPGSVAVLAGAAPFTAGGGDINGDNGVTASFNMLPEDQAHGWYLDVGYQVHPKWELDARYDRLDRATDTDAGEREFETLTLGAQYFLNKKTRVIFNYEFRDAEAPGLPSSNNANKILDDMDDRVSVQLLAVF